MTGHHPDHHTLERFACGDLTGRESHWIERHLRAGCPTCQAEVDRLLAPFDEGSTCLPCGQEAEASPRFLSDDPAALVRTFERLEQRLLRIELERAAAPGLVAALLALPPEARLPYVGLRADLATLAVCDLLSERSLQAAEDDPSAAQDFAVLAIEVAERLDAGHYGVAVVKDLKARAWAYLGNALRTNGDLDGADEALLYAESLAEDGSADPLEEARILDLRAALLTDMGRFDEAAELLDVAIEIYGEVQDPGRFGQAMLHKGDVLKRAGRKEAATPIIEEGLRWFQPPPGYFLG